jgi:phospholipid/cholesterol/gamma-HCH transport system substrate-binding protein
VKGVSSAVKVGVLVIVVAIGGYLVYKMVGERPSGGSDFSVWADFNDASGLPKGSAVLIAGLPVGEIVDLSIRGRKARITMQLRDDIVLWTNAVVFKKSSSLLGAFFLEIDPGTEATPLADGTVRENTRIENGGQIKNVVEAASVDAILRRFEETMPKVDSLIISVRELSENLRAIVNGPVKSIADNLDDLVRDETKTVSSILRRTDRTIARIEGIAGDLRRATAPGGKVEQILNNLDATVLSAKNEVESTGAAVRDRIDQLDPVFARADSIATKIDEDKGTLGRLVNDSTLIDNLEDISEDAKGFLGTLFGMKTYVGLRSEYGIRSGGLRSYISVELQTRPDKFYYIELEKGPRGDYPNVTLVYDPNIGRFRQTIEIEDKVRFTFQFAKRMDWLTLRYGLKESTGGIGADADWFDNRLKVSVDLFDATFDALPRLKVTAAYQLFGFLYVLGGVDEILNNPNELDIELVGGGEDGDIPTQFDTFKFGREAFFGAQLRFNDEDLAALLTVGGAILTGALN